MESGAILTSLLKILDSNLETCYTDSCFGVTQSFLSENNKEVDGLRLLHHRSSRRDRLSVPPPKSPAVFCCRTRPQNGRRSLTITEMIGPKASGILFEAIRIGQPPAKKKDPRVVVRCKHRIDRRIKKRPTGTRRGICTKGQTRRV